MRAVDHALTGAVIGLTINQPELSLPVALLSHYLLDSIPHFGVESGEDARKTWFSVLLVLDAVLCFSIVLILFLAKPRHWFVAAICSFLAAAPDAMLIPLYISAQQGKPINLRSKFLPLDIHNRIQHESPKGVIADTSVVIVMLGLFIRYI